VNVKKIVVGISVGWTLLSLPALGYLALQSPPAKRQPTPPRSKAAAPAHAARIARPPDLGVDWARPESPELAALLYRYFPQPLSQHYEEVFIRDYFEDRKGGFLVDVGASHYKTRSTTHYLDVALGWHGIAIDAIEELAADYARYRPRTKFFPVFVSDRSDEDVDFHVILGNSRLSTASTEAAQAHRGAQEIRKLKTVTLNALLESQGVEKIDLLSMDIELWEPKALAGFDIDRYQPELVVIEAHPPVRDEIFAYFAAHDYVLLEQYSKWDGRNAYFIPKAHLARFEARKRAERALLASTAHVARLEQPPASAGP